MKSSFWFICLVLAGSMLSAFRITIAGHSVLPVYLLILMMAWGIWQIADSFHRKRNRRKIYRLDIVVGALGMIAIVKTGITVVSNGVTVYADYADSLLIFCLVLFYFLSMRAKEFREIYLDVILYCGLIVMLFLLLGHFTDPMFGEWIMFWENKAMTGAYLILILEVAACRFCAANDKMQTWFYGLVAEMCFLLLQINQNTVSLWTATLVLLMIPVMIRPTALVWNRVAGMLGAFCFTGSVVALTANYGEVFLSELTFDLEHFVYLDMVLAVGGLLYFSCIDRIPEEADKRRILMKGLYRIDRRVIAALFCMLVLFLSGGMAWQNLSGDGLGVRMVKSFAVPLVKDWMQQGESLGRYIQKNGMLEIVLAVIIAVAVINRAKKYFSWRKPIHGTLCTVGAGMGMLLLTGQMGEGTLTTGVVLMCYLVSEGFAIRRPRTPNTNPTCENTVRRNED